VTPRAIPADFYARDTISVARDLLGCVLRTRVNNRITAGRIVEVEAYVGPNDPAAHGFGGRRTSRNDRLFGPPGIAYVYFIYGVHWCVNAVTEADGYPAAVLIRALEPLEGLDVMRRRRTTPNPRLWCSGPGRLCAAMRISRAMNGATLTGPSIAIMPRTSTERITIGCGPRIGITKAADWPLRFWEEGSPWVSRKSGGRADRRSEKERGTRSGRPS
jgi:DNA-3-methyladenine glycosylase